MKFVRREEGRKGGEKAEQGVAWGRRIRGTGDKKKGELAGESCVVRLSYSFCKVGERGGGERDTERENTMNVFCIFVSIQLLRCYKYEVQWPG